jgi:glycolate oxidase iron-sulfur subunit
VQAALEPGINAAAAQVLDRLGLSALRVAGAGCCGAVAQHLTAPDEALAAVRRNVDALWPLVESGVAAIGVTASACASMVSEYGRLLRDEPRYAARAERISALARDISQLVSAEAKALGELLGREAGTGAATPVRVAFHSPCTLQHALRITGVVEPLLAAAGYTLTAVAERHLCCGSAGTYSILQPQLSQQLLAAKCRALTEDAPDVIATANIGCLEHLRTGTAVPVRHWIELIAARLP